MRFSEALGLTAKDFDYANQTISINKTWDYKGIGGFQETKNKSSIRKIQIDWKTVTQFAGLLNNLDKNKPIFIDGKTYNSTINQILARHCKRVNIPQISIHGLRHTHASLLLYSGVSIASVARRLGHASMTTTQKIYLHVIQELENNNGLDMFQFQFDFTDKVLPISSDRVILADEYVLKLSNIDYIQKKSANVTHLVYVDLIYQEKEGI